MEDWYSKVRQLKDESVQPYFTEELCQRVYHDLRRMKVRDKGKFKQRMGPEFDNWIARLYQDYNPEMVKEIINDDDFWLLTLKMVRGF
jgi:hypothetical protein